MREWLARLVAWSFFCSTLMAETKNVKVFIALCDNISHGIVKVPAKISKGNIPAENLYWGCNDGLSSYFKFSKEWKLLRSEKTTDPHILECLIFSNKTLNIELTAEAWRGSDISTCLQAFETALISGKHQLVVYIGHNVLMDKVIIPPANPATISCDAMVLCCKSEEYFRKRLRKLQVRPVLLTKQFMYPGSFLLHDTLSPWLKDRSLAEIRLAAAGAYAHNQKISTKSAMGVFADLSISP